MLQLTKQRELFATLSQRFKSKLDEMENNESYLSIFNNESKMISDNQIEQVIMKLYCQTLNDDNDDDWDKACLLPDNASAKYWQNSVEFKYLQKNPNDEENENNDEDEEKRESENDESGEKIQDSSSAEDESDLRSRRLPESLDWHRSAWRDLKCADLLNSKGFYPQSVHYSQQAAEKSLKALLLFIEGRKYSWRYEHKLCRLARLVSQKFGSQDNLSDLSQKLESLGFDQWHNIRRSILIVRVRYGDVNDFGHLIYSTLPHVVYTSQLGKEAFLMAHQIFSIAQTLLQNYF